MAWGTLLLLAGPNGAGKTSVVGALLRDGWLQEFTMLNADDRTLVKLKAAGYAGFSETPIDVLKELFVEAANEVWTEALALLEGGARICLETVLSTAKYQEMVQQVIEKGGRFELVYVALNRWEISRERINLRVEKGGHDVPTDRLQERWKRSLEHLPWFASQAHFMAVFDNSSFDCDVDPVMLAVGERGRLSWRVPQGQVFPELRLALQKAFSTVTDQ